MDCTSSPHGLHFLYSTPGFPVLLCLLGFAQTHVHWVSNTIQISHLLLPPFPLALNFSQHQGLFQWVTSSYQVAKILELQLQHQYLPMNIQGWLPLRMTDWFHLFAVQGTLKSLLQHHNLKASILWHSVFFMVQLSHSYVTTGKIIALTIQTFTGKVMSLLFNTLSLS